MDSKFINKIEFEFGKVSFYKEYLCLEIVENGNFSVGNFDEVLHQKLQIIREQKVFFLGNRNYPTSFDPTIFIARKQQIQKNFLGLLIVSNRHNDRFEEGYVKKMCPVESHYFTSLKKAIAWIDVYKPNLEKYLV